MRLLASAEEAEARSGGSGIHPSAEGARSRDLGFARRVSRRTFVDALGEAALLDRVHELIREPLDAAALGERPLCLAHPPPPLRPVRHRWRPRGGSILRARGPRGAPPTDASQAPNSLNGRGRRRESNRLEPARQQRQNPAVAHGSNGAENQWQLKFKQSRQGKKRGCGRFRNWRRLAR